MTIDEKYTPKRSYKDQIKLDSERVKFIIKCEHCGHRVTMTDTDRTICTHCGYWIYKNEKAKFKYKLKEEMIKKTYTKTTEKC